MRAFLPAVAVAACFLISPGVAPGQSDSTVAITGRVTDAGTGLAVAAAKVSLQGGRVSVRTDSAGRWTINLLLSVADELPLVVEHPRYRQQILGLRYPVASSVTIRLEPLASSLDPIVVTASRREQRLSSIVVETSVFEATQLRETGAVDVAQALTDQSGIQLDGGTPAGAGAGIRGFDSRRVLVLVDGAPLAGRVAGNLDLSRLPLSMVERIEVVKGPQSTLHGSDALGGVINIITHRPARRSWTIGVSTGAGTQGRREAGASALWHSGTVGVSTDLGARTIDLAPGISGDRDTFARRGHGQTRVGWESSGGSTLSGTFLAIAERQRYRTGQLFRFSDNTQSGLRFDYARPFRGLYRLASSIHLSSFDHLSRASTLDTPVEGSGERDRQHLLQGELLSNGVIGTAAVDAGIALRWEELTADRIGGQRRSTTTIEPFAQAAFSSRGAVTIVPGLRLSVSERWGLFASPTLAAMWKPREAVALRASASSGFRAPDFKELYIDFVNSAAGYAVRGNEALRPERAATFAGSGELRGGSSWVRLGTFASRYRDFIETGEQDESGTFTYNNIASGSMRGIEVDGGLEAGNWTFNGGLELLRTRDDSSGLPLLGRPYHVLRAALGAPLGKVRGRLALHHSGPTPIQRSATGTIVERASFPRLDLRVIGAVNGTLDWSVGVVNALDRKIGSQWPGFTGRQLSGSVEWRASGRRGPRSVR
ncbi:MAG: TonB-dependent receptor [Gemmatimonadota bacterium]